MAKRERPAPVLLHEQAEAVDMMVGSDGPREDFDAVPLRQRRRRAGTQNRVESVCVGGLADGLTVTHDGRDHLQVGTLVEPGQDGYEDHAVPTVGDEDPQPITVYEWYLVDGGKAYHHTHDRAAEVREWSSEAPPQRRTRSRRATTEDE